MIFIAIILLIYLIPIILVSSLYSPQKSPSEMPQTAPQSTVISVYDKDEDKVTECGIEEYLVGVVAAEMPASYETEALKAQAVAARSYILSRQGSNDPRHKGADICNDPAHCKGYLSPEQANAKWGESWSSEYLDKIKAAVSATAGEYISYQGEVAVACFCAVSSGKTENASDVWGTDTPYLRSVDSSEDLNYKDFISTVTVSLSEFCQKTETASAIIGGAVRTEGGAVKEITIDNKTFSGTQIRSLFGLNSANFDILVEGDNVTFTVRGKGHGVGMSQYGANEMAKTGKKYTEILQHYYSNVTIEKI